MYVVILRTAPFAGRRIYGLVDSAPAAGRVHRSFVAKIALQEDNPIRGGRWPPEKPNSKKSPASSAVNHLFFGDFDLEQLRPQLPGYEQPVSGRIVGDPVQHRAIAAQFALVDDPTQIKMAQNFPRTR